jgi:hypothetical protein
VQIKIKTNQNYSYKRKKERNANKPAKGLSAEHEWVQIQKQCKLIQGIKAIRCKINGHKTRLWCNVT